MTASWCWFAHLPDQPSDAAAAARVTDRGATPDGWLAAWPAGRKPIRDAVWMDARLVDPHGDAAWVSLVLPAAGASPIFDDPAVSGALRAVLAGPPADAVSILVRDGCTSPAPSPSAAATRAPCATTRSPGPRPR